MAFYRQTYMPGYTTNDTYGCFYDSKKVSLITAPERLKNYDLDLRKTQQPTSGSEYGDFLRSTDPYSRYRYEQLLQRQQAGEGWQPPTGQLGAADAEDAQSADAQPQLQQLQEKQQLSRRAPPPPPEPPSGLRYQQQQQEQQQAPQRLASPPPPVSEERYRRPQPADDAGETRRLPRSRSPPPPPELTRYAANEAEYSGRRPKPGLEPLSRPLPPDDSLRRQPQPPPPPEAAPTVESLPPLLYGSREIRLPDIEAVELHMRDKSKILMNVQDFYRKYLRD